jgi:hypothetical protein
MTTGRRVLCSCGHRNCRQLPWLQTAWHHGTALGHGKGGESHHVSWEGTEPSSEETRSRPIMSDFIRGRSSESSLIKLNPPLAPHSNQHPQPQQRMASRSFLVAVSLVVLFACAAMASHVSIGTVFVLSASFVVLFWISLFAGLTLKASRFSVSPPPPCPPRSSQSPSRASPCG